MIPTSSCMALCHRSFGNLSMPCWDWLFVSYNSLWHHKSKACHLCLKISIYTLFVSLAMDLVVPDVDTFYCPLQLLVISAANSAMQLVYNYQHYFLCLGLSKSKLPHFLPSIKSSLANTTWRLSNLFNQKPLFHVNLRNSSLAFSLFLKSVTVILIFACFFIFASFSPHLSVILDFHDTILFGPINDSKIHLIFLHLVPPGLAFSSLL